MRRLLFLLLALWLMAMPALAVEEPEDYGADKLQEGLSQEVKEALEGFSPTEQGELGQGIAAIFECAARDNRSTLRQAAALAATLIGVVLLCGTVSAVHTGTGLQAASVVGALGITAACTVQFHAMIQLGAQTVQDMADYGTLLLPALASATVATGAVGSAGAIYAGTVLFSELLTVLIAKVLIPMVYLYIAVATANAAMDNQQLASIRDFLAWLITGSLKLILYVYTGYIAISGIVSGAADALSVKATKLALGGMIPVVGSIIADASETVVLSASVMKSSMGVFGMLAVLGFCAAPFLKLAIHYLLLKVTKAVCGTVGLRNHVELVDCLSKAMGFLLGMTGTCAVMLLLSAVCSLKVVMV